jgi:hypothetical protein
MFGARVLDSRPETAGIQPFRQTLDISPSLSSGASPPWSCPAATSSVPLNLRLDSSLTPPNLSISEVVRCLCCVAAHKATTRTNEYPYPDEGTIGTLSVALGRRNCLRTPHLRESRRLGRLDDVQNLCLRLSGLLRLQNAHLSPSPSGSPPAFRTESAPRADEVARTVPNSARRPHPHP